MVRREIFVLKGIAKKIVPRETLKKIRKVKDEIEKIELYKHAIEINLEKRIKSLEEKIKKYEKKQDLFHLSTKTELLNLKSKYFYVTHHKRDLRVVLKLLQSIEHEIFDLEKKALKKGVSLVK